MVVADTAVTVAEQLKRVPNAVRPTVNAARRMVKASAPNATEIAYQTNPPRSKSAMWKLARYAADGQDVAGEGRGVSQSQLRARDAFPRRPTEPAAQRRTPRPRRSRDVPPGARRRQRRAAPTRPRPHLRRSASPPPAPRRRGVTLPSRRR